MERARFYAYPHKSEALEGTVTKLGTINYVGKDIHHTKIGDNRWSEVRAASR